MSRNRNHETITMSRRPASPGMCVPFAGVSSHTEPIPSGGRGRRIPACGAASVFSTSSMTADVAPHRPGAPSHGSAFVRPRILSIHKSSASHCGVSFHSNNFGFLLVELFPTSWGSATSRPAAGLRPLHSLGVPFAAFAANENSVFWHRFKVARTPERCPCTVPEAGFAPAATPAPLIRMDGVPLESGKSYCAIRTAPSFFHLSTPKPYE